MSDYAILATDARQDQTPAVSTRPAAVAPARTCVICRQQRRRVREPIIAASTGGLDADAIYHLI